MARKVLFIVGSHRKNSFNRQLANEIIAMIGARAYANDSPTCEAYWRCQ